MSQSRKVAVVTGGASGIGLACAEMFSRTHHVVIGDLKNAEQAAAELPVAGTGVRMDVCSVEGCERLAGTASSLGAVEVLVHCAGILMQPTVRIEEMDPERWRRIIDVNLTGTFLVTRALAPVLADSGSIVLVASRTGRTGSAALRLGDPSRAEYSTSKAAVISYVKSLAQELAPRGIRVNGIAPGPVSTSLSTPGREKMLSEHIPLGRTGTTADITPAVAFLCSEGASWITGHVLDVNGGMTM